MGYILVPNTGEKIFINIWHWKPTMLLIFKTGLVDQETYIRMSNNFCRGKVDSDTANRIADLMEIQLSTMLPGERMRMNFTVTNTPMPDHFTYPDDNYSATYEWLEEFRDFCRSSDGFEVA
jgi:hypothetical protein